MLRNGAARILLGLGIILISIASKIDPDYVQSAILNLIKTEESTT
ncbi:unnamed protein product [marine sediment metagenome]|uniref:Uncharacterized protein n=1 Tax=marine sediment metagenome TaxID=412755 RepID=X1H3U8_9ZZZZ